MDTLKTLSAGGPPTVTCESMFQHPLNAHSVACDCNNPAHSPKPNSLLHLKQRSRSGQPPGQRGGYDGYRIDRAGFVDTVQQNTTTCVGVAF